MRRALGLALLGTTLCGTLGAQASARVGGELTGQHFGSVLVPIAVDMSATGGAKLGSYTARLTWSPTALTFTAALPGNFPQPQVNTDSTAFGVLKFTSVSPAGTGGLVTLAQLQYSVPDTVPSPLTLSFSEMSAAGTFADLLPGLTVSSATFCPSRGYWGDIDRDGASNSRDALLVLSKVVGLPVDTTIDTVSTSPLVVDTLRFDSGLGDVNADGAVTSVDALIILSTAVGIPIPGQRVMILAPGGCGTGSPKTLAVVPGAADLVVGQSYQLLAQGRDTAGRTVTLSNATWRSSNLNVAGVDANGTVHARAPGAAVITAAVGPGISATGTVTVVAGRSKWYVDASVTGAPVQFGTAAFPFDNPLAAFPLLREGDTMAVAPGNYDFANDGTLAAGVVIQGGTPGDTTTRPLFRDAPAGSHVALRFTGGQRALIQNVMFRGFSYAIELQGVHSLALEDARIFGGPTSFVGINGCWSGVMDSLRVDRTDFAGDSLLPGTTGIEFNNCGAGVALRTLTVRDSKMRFFGDGLYLYDVDSTAVIRSQLLDNNGYGIALYQSGAAQSALWMSHSRIDRAANTAIYGYPLRRVVVDTSEILATKSNAIQLNFCDCSGTGTLQVRMHDDSINVGGSASGYSWLDAVQSDTVSIDRTVVRYPADTAFTSYASVDAALLSVTRSQFLNVAGGTPVYASGGSFVGDSLTFTGCAVAGCDGATAVTVYPGGTAPFASLQRSSFTQLATPFFANGPAAVTFAHNVSDSVTNGIQIQADTASVTDNRFTRVGLDALRLYLYSATAVGPSTVARDTITCSAANAGHGISASGIPLVAEDNLVTGCYFGIYDQQSVNGSVLRRNTIRTPVDGIVVTANATVTMRVDSNGVSGADTGVYRLGSGRLTMTHNNVSGNVTGVFIDGGAPAAVVHVLHDNSFTGDTKFAVFSSVDTVNAQANWWGLATGSHSGAGSDSTFGIVDTTNFLAAPPANLPGLAPPFLATATPIRTTAVRPLLPVAARPSPPPRRLVRAAPPRVQPALVIPPRMSFLQAAALQERARQHAEQDAKDALARGVTRP